MNHTQTMLTLLSANRDDDIKGIREFTPERLKDVADYILRTMHSPEESAHGTIPALLSLPNIEPQHIAIILTHVYSGLKYESLKKNLHSNLRKIFSQEHQYLDALIKRRPDDWQNVRRLKWLTPDITIGKVKGESRFEVRRRWG